MPVSRARTYTYSQIQAILGSKLRCSLRTPFACVKPHLL